MSSTSQADARLGLRLRQLRKDAGLDQKELAGMLGVTGGSVSQQELGKRRMSPQKLQEWAEACGASVEIVFIRGSKVLTPEQSPDLSTLGPDDMQAVEDLLHILKAESGRAKARVRGYLALFRS